MEISNLLFALIDSDGPGGVIILIVLIAACAVYYGLTRWIIGGSPAEKAEQQLRSEVPKVDTK